MNINSNINGTFESLLPRETRAPCWKSKQTTAATELQDLLDNAQNGVYTALDAKINSYMKEENRFFRLTEGKFHEVTPGKYKTVQLKIQVKEGTITWYFMKVGHDETTQEFRNQVFRTAALGHLLVPEACAKYYRGTNSMHVKRMHTSEQESMRNHNHYRVNDDHVTVSQFKSHLEGFLQAQKAYGLGEKFLNKDEVEELVEKYEEFDKSLDLSDNGMTLREKFHQQEQEQWTELDKSELDVNKSLEEPCEAEVISLNEKEITVLTEGEREEKIFPKQWVELTEKLSPIALDKIAKVGSSGLKSEVAQTRQMKDSSLPPLLNAYTRIGELFEKENNTEYPPVEPS